MLLLFISRDESFLVLQKLIELIKEMILVEFLMRNIDGFILYSYLLMGIYNVFYSLVVVNSVVLDVVNMFGFLIKVLNNFYIQWWLVEDFWFYFVVSFLWLVFVLFFVVVNLERRILFYFRFFQLQLVIERGQDRN